jgi:hypothetical protein
MSGLLMLGLSVGLFSNKDIKVAYQRTVYWTEFH